MANGGILWTPGSAARSLLIWAIDLWHFINGKALVNGINLLEMEASDMLDVVHYFFEEDMNYSTAEQAKAHEKIRISVYKNLYNETYKYASSSSKSYVSAASNDEFFASPEEKQDNLSDVKPFNPRGKTTKPFTPSTDVSRLSSVLDDPLG
jgi:hypothetical protein